MAETKASQRKSAKLSLVQPARSRPGKIPEIIRFDRKELNLLLNVYGKKVAKGEWRDYAMDMLADRALFSIYRRTSERPQFVVEKNPRLRNKQGQYIVTNAQGKVLKRGHELEKVLRVLEPSLIVIK